MVNRLIALTEKEWLALRDIIDNGWVDGGYEGWGGVDPEIQKSAISKVRESKRIGQIEIILKADEIDITLRPIRDEKS